VRLECQLWRLVLVLHRCLHAELVDGRVVSRAIHAFKSRMMGEVVRWEPMLLHLKRVDFVERLLLHMLREMRLEPVVGSDLMTGMQGAFRGWQRERSAETKPEPRRMEITGLMVVDRIRATWRRSVVARHLVREHVEAVAVGIHY